ncbi:MAG: flagellar basal body-associated FliL family protein [Nocardioidaceae bacterium]|nr:flagellar basal body-associated FliL family protein [Nocardioidaceae bacterium]MCL2613783.1 flagellar basal body-associated FliL family protein [Nocardioidaceae bacterium]
MTAVAVQPAEAAEEETEGRSRKKLVIVVLVVLLALGGAGYWFFLKPPPGAPQPGTVTPLDQIQINLAEGHYLRLGIALQLTKSTKDVDGSQALDAAINLFSGLPVTEVDNRSSREKLQARLDKTLEQKYDGQVMDVYFTEFVTQ